MTGPPMDVTSAIGSTTPGPADPTKPAPHLLTFDEWQSAQSAPGAALTSGDPRTATTNGYGRLLTYDEWDQAQRMTPSQIAQWKIPAMPAAERPASLTPAEPKTPATLPGPLQGLLDWAIRENAPTEHLSYLQELTEQSLGAAIAHPLQTAALPVAAMAAPLGALAVGTYVTGSVLANVAQYGYQKYLEVHASPDVRKAMEADPERISGASAAAQATLLGLGSLVHAGVKGVNAATDVGAGMMEAGAEGVKQSDLGPDFAPGFNAAHKNADFAAALEQGAAEAQSAPPVKRPNGFTPTSATAQAAPGRAPTGTVEGLETPETVKPGRVKPIETEPASAPLQQAADINASVRDYQAKRVAEDTKDIADERTAAAERLLGLREDDAARVERETATTIRRRPQGQRTPFLESPQGANLLGSTAAARGLPDDASPYPATSPLDAAWKAGHDAVTSQTATMEAPASYPNGYTMGGALTDNRIPDDYTPRRLPRTERAPEPAEAPEAPPSNGNGAAPVASPIETVNSTRDLFATAREEGERRSLERAVNTDALTGLGNQRAFRAALPKAEADPNTRVIRFDVNGFKSVNDAHGHTIGDDVLADLGHTIRAHAPGLPAFRVGGDEFAVLAPADQAETIRDAIEQHVGVREINGPHFETGEPTTTFHSISGGIGDTDAEADALAKMRKTEQKAAQGIPDRAPSGGASVRGEGNSSNSTSPIEGTGESRTRGLAQGVADKAIENRLGPIGELPGYRRMSLADQARLATRLLAENPELAARVARGEAPPPRGLLPESVFVAVEQRAIEQGDVNTLRDLATSRLTGEATTMGQRIRTLGERDPESPVAAIQDVIDTRSGGAANAEHVAKATNDEVDAIDKHLAGVAVTKDAWAKFIDDIKC